MIPLKRGLVFPANASTGGAETKDRAGKAGSAGTSQAGRDFKLSEPEVLAVDRGLALRAGYRGVLLLVELLVHDLQPVHEQCPPRGREDRLGGKWPIDDGAYIAAASPLYAVMVLSLT